MKKIHIAIDGPAGAGKSTIAKKLAEKIKVDYLDTGAMYRAVTYDVLENNIDLEDEEAIVQRASNINIDFIDNEIHIDGVKVEGKIRTPRVSNSVSRVAKIPKVREIMKNKQRKIAEKKSVIMDGRDIGTVVLPNADYKFYLDASIEIRAKRRYEELKEKEEVSFEQIKEEIALRDELDSNREVAPLKIAEDAVVIDTSNMSIDDVLEKIVDMINGGK